MKTTTYLSSKDGMTCTITDQPVPTRADILRTNLTILVTAYDYSIRQRAARNPRVYHNGFALSLYMEAIEAVVTDCESGYSVPEALNNTFTGHMLSYLLRKAAR